MTTQYYGQWDGLSNYFNPDLQPGYNYFHNNNYQVADVRVMPEQANVGRFATQVPHYDQYDTHYSMSAQDLQSYHWSQNNLQSYPHYSSNWAPAHSQDMSNVTSSRVIQTSQQPIQSINEKVKNKTSRVAKPPYSYIALICMAIADSQSKKPTLKEIIKFIESHFPYYQSNKKWHGSIRHNLTLNDCFVKLPRSSGEKCCRWTINPEFEDMFDNGSLRRRRYRYKEGSSNWKKTQLEIVAKQMHKQSKMGSSLKQAIRNSSPTDSRQKTSENTNLVDSCPVATTVTSLHPDIHNLSNNSSEASSLLDPLSPVTPSSSVATSDASFVFDSQSLEEFSALLDGEIDPYVNTL